MNHTRLSILTHRVGEHFDELLKGSQASAATKLNHKAVVAAVRQRVLADVDGRDLPSASVDNLLLHALRLRAQDKYRPPSDDQQIVKLLGAIFGVRMPAKLESVAPALEKAAALAERATKDEIRAITRDRGVKATSPAGLEKELKNIAKLALLGEWPEVNEAWLGRAMKAGVSFDLLERYYDVQRCYWEVALHSIPPKLDALAAKGSWDPKLEAEYARAAFHLSRGQYGLADAKERLRRGPQEDELTHPSPSRLAGRPVPALVPTSSPELDAIEALGAKADALVARFLGQIEAEANRALQKDQTTDFAGAAEKALDRRWSKILAAVEAAFPKNTKGTALRSAVKEQREQLSSKDRWHERMQVMTPDLRLGETFAGEPVSTSFEYAGSDEASRQERKGLVEGLIQAAPPATHLDEGLLQRALNALDIQMLRDLRQAGYHIKVVRHLLTNGDSDLPPMVGHGDGLHRHDGPAPSISVRSYFRDGALQLDVSTLLHEIGHAYDLRIRGSEEEPLHLKDKLVAAFKAEHESLPPYFHDQAEFAAEAIARYLADPDRAGGQLWQTKQALDGLGLGALTPDIGALAELQSAQVAKSAVNVKPDPFVILEKHEQINRLRAQSKTPLEPMIMELDGTKDQGSELLAASLAHALRLARSPGTLPYRNGEALVRVSADVFNDAGKLRAVLDQTVIDRRGAFILLDELPKIPNGSPGFEVIKKHFARFGGEAHILLEGPQTELDRFHGMLPTAARTRLTMDALKPAQLVENVLRTARAEGYELSAEAMSAFASRAGSGGLSRAQDLWKSVKETHAARMNEQMSLVERDAQAVMRILRRDVQDAPIAEVRDPLKELSDMVGLESAKTVIRQILGHMKLGGDPSQRPRLNLLFSGNPGTGKTTVADLFTEILHERGALQRKKVAKPLLQDVVDGNPEANVKRLFEDNKGGVIFFDEFHQLKETEAGKRAFRAMIPYLGSAAYKDTVFIGAGYDDEVKEMIRDLDKGGERRFQNVPFDDYKPEALAKICALMARMKHIELSKEAKEAALARIAREQRCMMNFGNAGTVETVLAGALNKCIDRVANLEGASAQDMMRLRPEDFAPDPVVGKEEVWKEIEALRGNESLKKQLKTIGASIDVARYLGEDPLASFEPYIVIAGPRGSGKSTIARILAKFFAAYDIVPTSKLVECAGPDLQGKFVGHTPSEVKSLFRSAWGGTLFIDEVSGLAKAGGTFKDEVAKTMLPILENNRGRFIMAVADYPENIDLFFAMDAGLESRFGVRLETEGMSGQHVAEEIVRQLESLSRSLEPKLMPVLRDYAEKLSALPNFANGRDARTLAGAIRNAHNAELAELIGRGEAPKNPKSILPGALREACEEILHRKEAQTLRAGSTDEADPALYASEVKAQVLQAVKPKQSSGGADRVLSALAEVNQAFAELYGNDPAALMAARSDPTSAYAQQLAEKLGVEPKAAIEAAAKTEAAIGKSVKVRSLKRRFEYHCPFCGGIDSQSCAYINMPLGWKIANSLKKPWTETVEEVLGAKS